MTNQRSEKDIEKYLVRRVKSDLGGLCLKFVSPGYSGVPDRLILAPSGVVAFAELKAPHKTERPLQIAVQARLRKLGFTVFSHVDSYEAVNDCINYLTTLQRHSNGLTD